MVEEREDAEGCGIDVRCRSEGEMWKLHASFVGKYAEQDAAVTLRLWDRLRADIDKDEVTSIFELETSLIPLMLDMKQKVCVSMSIRHTMCRRN